LSLSLLIGTACFFVERQRDVRNGGVNRWKSGSKLPHSKARASARNGNLKVIWSNSNSLPEFEGVIESMSSRYTMFLPSGQPVRATTTINMKEAAGAKSKSQTEETCPPYGN
jgi:hypothetical protein